MKHKMKRDYVARGKLSPLIDKDLLTEVLKRYESDSNISRIHRMVIYRTVHKKSYDFIGVIEGISANRASEIIRKLNLRLNHKLKEKL